MAELPASSPRRARPGRSRRRIGPGASCVTRPRSSCAFAGAIARHPAPALAVAARRPGRRAVLDALFTATSAVCVTGLVIGRHPDVLERVRAGGHPAADPGRWLRDHDPRVAGRVAARRAGWACGLGSRPPPRPRAWARRRPRRAGRRRRGQPALRGPSTAVAADRCGSGIGYDEPLGPSASTSVCSTRSRRSTTLASPLFSDSLMGFVDRPVDLPADRRGGHLRRPRASRSSSSCAAAAARRPRRWTCTPSSRWRHRGPAGAGHRLRHRERVEQPRDARRPRRAGRGCSPASSRR